MSQIVKSVCVYCGASNGASETFLQIATDVGRALGENRIRLVYGGGGIGLMGAVADAAAAIDEANAVLRERAADVGSDFEEGFGSAVGGAAIDANRLDNLTHFQSKGPSPWPFFFISLVTPVMAGIGHPGKSGKDSSFGPRNSESRGIPATVGRVRRLVSPEGDQGESTCDFVLLPLRPV